MKTPIYDFVKEYAEKNPIRFHMPGHKGTPFLGPEPYDITEISDADILYHGNGIIKESENIASSLFDTAMTLYSCEGSSLSIRAMLYLLKLYALSSGQKPVILASRNAHKTFVTSAALLDIDVKWIYSRDASIISCHFDMNDLEENILKYRPQAFYITSPDYLGNIYDIKEASEICRKHNVLLAVDNAHGSYLRFLDKSKHPINTGADICCDSAHKTLPVITGGGYLHISESAPAFFKEHAEKAMSLFATTSPSYLILESLDTANSVLENNFSEQLQIIINRINKLKSDILNYGYNIIGDEPIKLTIAPKSLGYTGTQLAEILEGHNIFPEFSDPDFLVLMFSPQNSNSDIDILEHILLSLPKKEPINTLPPVLTVPEAAISPHNALWADSELTPAIKSKGKMMASVSATCPPAIPIVILGERINNSCLQCFSYYGIKSLFTVKN